jgi:hypothetical protein
VAQAVPGAAVTPCPPPAALGAAPALGAAAALPARSFTAQTGLLLHQVIPAREKDFVMVIAYLRAALEKTTDETRRAQARGWQIFRVPEPGPNGDVLYAFLLDPAVPCVDYALSPILAEAYPDPAQLQEIWRLYQGSVRSGGSLLNLVPVPVEPPPPILAPPVTPTVPGQTPTTPGQTPPT